MGLDCLILPIYSIAIVGALTTNIGIYFCNLSTKKEFFPLTSAYWDTGTWIIITSIIATFLSIIGGLSSNLFIGAISAGVILFLMVITIILIRQQYKLREEFLY